MQYMNPVNKKRRYASPRRQQQAEATRAAILDAARELFTEKGWSATTITAIARSAAVAPETIYAHFGNKRAIVQAMVVAAMRGGEPGVPMMEQAERRRVHGQTDPDAMIEAFAADLAGLVSRVAPVLGAIRGAAETDDEMRELYLDLHAARRRNLGTFVERLKAIGGLRDGLDVETATTHVWSLGSPELFLLWTGVAGAEREAFRDWFAAALKRLLR